MNRLFNPTIAVLGLGLAVVASGCGSDSGSTTPTTTTDTASSTDAGSTTGDTSTGGGDATSSTDTSSGGSDSASTDTTPPKPAGCDPACKDGEYCDLMATPPVCKAQTCKLPGEWGPEIQKASKLAVAAGTVGCDLDGDGKPNNAVGAGLAALLKTANDALSKGVKDGSITILMETKKTATDGTDFAVNMLLGDLDASNADCDGTTASCKYTVNPASYDVTKNAETCPAFIAFPNAKIKEGKMTAGGKEQVFTLNLPLQGIVLSLSISQATVEATVTTDPTWSASKDGLICGVITKDALGKAIDAIPEESIASLGLGNKDQVKALIGGFLKTDMDIDGDGTKDAYSVAIQWESVKGAITGLTPKK
jgi:hypothetical protein